MNSSHSPNEYGVVFASSVRVVDIDCGAHVTQVFDRLYTVPESAADLFVVQRLSDHMCRAIVLNDAPVPQVGARLRRRDPPSPASFPAPVVAQLLRSGPSTTTPSPVRTGIKVVDLLCPFPQQGTAVLVGGPGVGRMTFIKELSACLGEVKTDLQLIFPIVAARVPLAARDGGRARGPRPQHMER